jgi:hypothetical protein
VKVSSRIIRTGLVLGAAGLTVAAMVLSGVTGSAVAASSHKTLAPGGYPSPGGIYRQFTDCPLLNPLMQESVGGNATGCVAGRATSGTIKIGNITTPITSPVVVQFGVWDPPPLNGTDQFTGGILPPPQGLPAQLVSSPELVPGGLLKALGCPSKNKTVESLCTKATKEGGKALDVYAQAESAGPITNFDLVTWTQPLMFQLINPLLGKYCYIGSQDNPVVVNPMLTGNLVEEVDPDPTAHPDTAVLKIEFGKASDTTFTAPGVTGCGPGGEHNIAVDEAIDTSTDLPSATGTNSLTLKGTFWFAANYAPGYMANGLLKAFEASVGEPTPSVTRQLGQLDRSSLRTAGIGIK